MWDSLSLATLKVRNSGNRTFPTREKSMAQSWDGEPGKERSNSSNLSRRQRFVQNRKGKGSWREYLSVRKRVGNEQMGMPIIWRFSRHGINANPCSIGLNSSGINGRFASSGLCRKSVFIERNEVKSCAERSGNSSRWRLSVAESNSFVRLALM